MANCGSFTSTGVIIGAFHNAVVTICNCSWLFSSNGSYLNVDHHKGTKTQCISMAGGPRFRSQTSTTVMAASIFLYLCMLSGNVAVHCQSLLKADVISGIKSNVKSIQLHIFYFNIQLVHRGYLYREILITWLDAGYCAVLDFRGLHVSC